MDSTDKFRSTVDSLAKVLDYLSPGVTPVLGAVLVGDVALVGELVEAGYDPNAETSPKYGRPLEVAARTGNADMCRELVAAGADVREKDVLAAIGACSLAATKALLPSYVQKVGREHGGTEVFYAAVESGSADIVAAVLDAPLGYAAKLNATPAGKAFPPLGAAIGKNSPRVAKLLIDRGADVSGSVVENGVKLPYLHFAAHCAGGEVVRVLLDAGVAIDAEEGGERAIHKACEHSSADPAETKRQEEVLRVLVDRGADISTRNAAGRTVMQVVARVEPLRRIIASAKTANSVAGMLEQIPAPARAGTRAVADAVPL